MKYRVLIVEDELITLNIFKNILKEDYEVVLAEDGEKAYEFYKKFNPHVIISDLNMPIMNGIELIKKIREIDQNTKIIITTSKNDIPTLLEAAELKLFKYLIKPINHIELKKMVEESIKEFNRFDTITLDNIKLSNELIWKRDNFELFYKNILIKLTPKEKKVLNFLLKKPNKVFHYNEIIYEIWEKENEFADRKTLKTLIANLRKRHESIKVDNVYGFGYKIILS